MKSLLSATFLWGSPHYFDYLSRGLQNPLHRLFFADLRQLAHSRRIGLAAGLVPRGPPAAGRSMRIRRAALAVGQGVCIRRAALAVGQGVRIRIAELAVGQGTRIQYAGLADEKDIGIRRAEPILRAGWGMDIVADLPERIVVAPNIQCVCAFL